LTRENDAARTNTLEFYTFPPFILSAISPRFCPLDFLVARYSSLYPHTYTLWPFLVAAINAGIGDGRTDYYGIIGDRGLNAVETQSRVLL
jgi:hypothetical protein